MEHGPQGRHITMLSPWVYMTHIECYRLYFIAAARVYKMVSGLNGTVTTYPVSKAIKNIIQKIICLELQFESLIFIYL